MKIFISWSGPRSKILAETLKDWMQLVLQATEPWMSSKDIHQGDAWFQKLREQLESTKRGLICLTPSNMNAPWLLFEAGAIAKQSGSHVCTLLIDLKPTDVTDPLSAFQHTELNKDSFQKLIYEINEELGERKLSEELLKKSFEKHWDDLEVAIKKCEAAKDKSDAPAKRTSTEMMEELLESSRFTTRGISALQSIINQMAQQSVFGNPWGSPSMAFGGTGSPVFGGGNQPLAGGFTPDAYLNQQLYAQLNLSARQAGTQLLSLGSGGQKAEAVVKQGTLNPKAEADMKAVAKSLGFELKITEQPN